MSSIEVVAHTGVALVTLWGMAAELLAGRKWRTLWQRAISAWAFSLGVLTALCVLVTLCSYGVHFLVALWLACGSFLMAPTGIRCVLAREQSVPGVVASGCSASDRELVVATEPDGHLIVPASWPKFAIQNGDRVLLRLRVSVLAGTCLRCEIIDRLPPTSAAPR